MTSMPDGSEPSSSVQIRHAADGDAPALAQLMAEEIRWGRIRELGPRFATLLHRHMIASRHAICLVAQRDGQVLGYAAGTTDNAAFNREFLLRRGVWAVLLLLPKLLRPRNLATIVRGLTYFPAAHPEDPKAEMLSFAVRASAKQSGIGRALAEAMTVEFRARGARAIKFGTVEVSNTAAIAFYERLGCQRVRTVRFYRNSQVHVYVYRIA